MYTKNIENQEILNLGFREFIEYLQLINLIFYVKEELKYNFILIIF